MELGGPHLGDLFRKWTADCTTVEAVAEKMITEQLLNMMPNDLRIWLSEKKPTSCREAGCWADDYVLVQQRSWVDVPRSIQDCKQPSGSPNCDTGKCHVCAQPGHWAWNCPQEDGRQWGNNQWTSHRRPR